MPQMIRSVLLLALLLSPLMAPASSLAEPGRGRLGPAIPTEFYRDPIPACKQDFDLPQVHNLPTGVGDVSIKSCYNNGFTTVHPNTENIGSCKIAVKSRSIIERGNFAWDQSCVDRHIGRPEKCKVDCKDTPKGLKNKPECTPGLVKIIRRKYHCRFKGAGAVLGETGEARTSGSKIFFRGEEPENFTTKDPNCQQIFKKLFTEENKYGYLE